MAFPMVTVVTKPINDVADFEAEVHAVPARRALSAAMVEQLEQLKWFQFMAERPMAVAFNP